MMHHTRNDLNANARTASIVLLNARLAETIDLALLTKQAHWTVRGAQFVAVHEMLDTFRTDLDGAVDTIAERISQLGGTPLGTVQAVAAGSKLPPYPTSISYIPEQIDALVDRYAPVANATRAAIEEAATAGDADTADILTSVSRALDKALWFLEAHHNPPKQD